MIKPILRSLWLPLAICGLLSCAKSPFDPATNEGANILNSLDSTIANFKTAYRLIDTLVTVDSVASHRDLGSHAEPMEVGWLNGEKSIAYFRFDSLLRFINQNIDTIDTVMLHIPLASSSLHLASTRVQLSRCAIRDTSTHTIFDTSTIQTQSQIDTQFAFDSTNTIDTVVLNLGAFRAGFKSVSAVIRDTGSFQTILPCDTNAGVQCTTYVRFDSTRTIDTAWIRLPDSAFCITPVDSGRVVRFGTPSLEIRFSYQMSHASTSQSAIRTENSVFEANPAALNPRAVSGYESGRYSVIKLNMASLWDSVKAPSGGKHFATVNGCNLLISPYDTTQLNAELNSPIRIFYHLAPYHALVDTADTSVTTLQRLDVAQSQIEPNHTFILSLQADANTLYAGGKSPPAECNLFIRMASTDGTWRWTDWNITTGSKLRIQAAATNPQ